MNYKRRVKDKMDLRTDKIDREKILLSKYIGFPEHELRSMGLISIDKTQPTKERKR